MAVTIHKGPPPPDHPLSRSLIFFGRKMRPPSKKELDKKDQGQSSNKSENPETNGASVDKDKP